MASFPELRRSGSVPATTGRFGFAVLASPVPLAVALAFLAAATLAAFQLAGLGGGASAPEFLTRALGSPEPTSS
ncbi:MAG: hypothetical protein M3R70_04575, partial [Actinomycetota bacterium]|nr:hypothetical protein [Actinomycetota bacterium]